MKNYNVAETNTTMILKKLLNVFMLRYFYLLQTTEVTVYI